MTIQLDELFERNRRWAAATEQRSPGFFTRLLAQQAPQYLWIGCADSRVPANELVDLLPGELFVHRNVANVVAHSDLNCLSVIQFAVDVLQVQHIIVVGHSRCGGVTAALEGRRVGLADNWLRHVQDVRDRHADWLAAVDDAAPRRRARASSTSSSRRATSARPRWCSDAWARGQELVVHGWFYGLQNGLLAGPAHAPSTQPRATLERGVRAARSQRRRSRRLRGTALSDPRRATRAPAVFPPALTDARAFAIAQAMLDGFDRHYRLFRAGQRRGQGALRGGRLARPAARAGAAHRVLRPARRRGGRAAAERVRGRRRCRWTSGSRSSCTTSAC